MEEENGESEREFPGLYASETACRSDSDCMFFSFNFLNYFELIY